MAIRTILDFFRPSSPDNAVRATDLIHLGRDANLTPNKDIALTGAEFFNSMNSFAGCFGAPTAPASLTPSTITDITNYPSAVTSSSATPDETAGTITIGTTGVYRVNMLLTLDSSDNNQNFALYLRSSTSGDQIMAGLFFPNGAGDLMSMSANTLYALTAGDVITMAIWSDAAVSSLVYHNASFDIAPTALT